MLNLSTRHKQKNNSKESEKTKKGKAFIITPTERSPGPYISIK